MVRKNTELLKGTSFGGESYQFDFEDAPVSSGRPIKKKEDTHNTKVPRNVGIATVLQKIADDDYDFINYHDWIFYFMHKAKEHGVTYVRGDKMKESSIIRSLVMNYSPQEIKGMMDFVWDVWKPPTELRKSTIGIWVFSKGWLPTVLQLTKEWREGRYTQHNLIREWTPSVALQEESKVDPKVEEFGKEKGSRVFI